ncbi:MAG: hypothetical protein BWY84_00318 [Candidatus Aerophobetes bacterium ADurb.Bin490]|nr:MAG: hypothetical protein BWY84_00318 [Candidatus Aerophobetes bacterium ADurb.Bin490]
MARIATVAAMAAKVISRAPRIEALILFSPFSKWRVIFSAIIMASSTTIPMTSETARKVNVLRVKPIKPIIKNAPNMDIGIVRNTLNAARSEPKKSQHTSDVSITERKITNTISSAASRINFVPSDLIRSSIPSGIILLISAAFSFTLSATATEFSPRCFLIPIPTDSIPSVRAILFMS